MTDSLTRPSRAPDYLRTWDKDGRRHTVETWFEPDGSKHKIETDEPIPVAEIIARIEGRPDGTGEGPRGGSARTGEVSLRDHVTP